ncbi:MAG TPA: TRAP transporter small permease [Rhizobiaceae bacterium]|nr:TRAP transporter small permease [Rhizobiaceae bacterium]
MAQVLSRLSRVSLYLAGIGIVVMTGIVFWQVFCRYVLNWSQSWTEITAVLLMSWFIFLGAAVGIRENYHLGFDVLLYVLPEGSKKTLRMLSDIVVLCFAAGMVYYGWQLVALSWPARMPSLGIPEGTKYLPVVGGGVLIILFALERIVLRLAGEDVDGDIHSVEEAPTMEAIREA